MTNENENSFASGEPHEPASAAGSSHGDSSSASGVRPNAGWDVPEEGGITFSSVVHALRRSWPLATAVGVPLGILVAAVLWLNIPVKYEAIAELRVKAREELLLPDIDPSRPDSRANDYEIFRKTQASLITSTFVLTDVLRKPEIAKLPMLAKEKENAIGFLQANIQTSYPKDAEVLLVSLRGEDPAQIVKIVDAVTDSYLEAEVNKRRQRLASELARVRQAHAHAEVEIRKLREAIHQKKVSVGAQDTAQARIRHQLELEQLRRLDDRRAELSRRVHENALRMALRETAPSNNLLEEFPEYLIEEQLESDDQYKQLLVEFDTAQQRHAATAAAARPTAPSVQRAAALVGSLRGQLNARRRQLQSRIAKKLRAEMSGATDGQHSLATLEAEQRILKARLNELNAQYQEQFDFVRQLDDFSATIQSDAEELAHSVSVNRARQQKIYDLTNQLDSPDRIQKIQDATIPNSNSRAAKILQVLLAAVVTIALAAAGIVLWDLLGARINSAREVSEALGTLVIGRLPSLRKGLFTIRWMSQPALDAVMTENIDAVRTALMRRSLKPMQQGQTPVILITSATGGEGKSTLAGHLALSYGRAGRKTLLIDGDTHNPQQHEMFGVDGGAGLCEALHAGQSAQEWVRSTQFDGVFVLPAGRSTSKSHQALTNGEIRMLIRELSSDFEVIVIDAGPVLTSTEALLLGQVSQQVVLSVMRDVSRVSKITDARDQLLAVDIELTGAVIHGVPAEVRRSGTGNSYASRSYASAPEAEVAAAS